jgi:hypothetical protein
MNSGLTVTANTASPAMGYPEYLKVNPDYEATMAGRAGASLRKVQSGFGYPTPVSGGTVETGNCLSMPLHATQRPRHFPTAPDL